ncbi:MAG: C_GCAxxG_C_C family protein [Oscillospiraceae bacterium]|nr:C_GCAxxG_C_C family protein [Oscillospiraceae bacterium]
MNHEEKARELFKQGYNCSQAVLLAFCDVTGLNEQTALMLSSSFGGGMGRMREVCGAVSGMFMVAGLLYGYSEPHDQAGKTAHYKRIQALAEEFRKENGSIICRELLGLPGGADSHVPEPRTDAYYKKRPCAELVALAARIMDAYIENNRS